MSFKRLTIRYQTARSLPAPYAYFYTIDAKPVAGDRFDLKFAITYPDRDDIDDDELIAEGFTREDDFSWSGQLPGTWLDAFVNLISKTKLQLLDEARLGEDDDFWAITIETNTTKTQEGQPAFSDDWQYLLQELIQAIYESMSRERPFELTYLDLTDQSDQEMHIVASFAERTVQLTQIKDRRESRKTLPWSTVQSLLAQVYEHDYAPDEAQTKRPTRRGQWLNLGTDEWHEISRFRALTRHLHELERR